MKKLSKKLLALVMAAAMLLTMLPLNAFSALASGNTSVKQYLVNSIDSDFTVGTGVTWDAGENAAYFNGDNSAFLTLNSNPLSGVTTSSGFAISFDVKRYDNVKSMARILDINDNTNANTFAINGGIDGNNGEKYSVLDKFGGAETRYNPATFQAEEKQGVWYTVTVVFDTDNSIKLYVDGVLKDTFTDTKNTLTNISSLTKTLVGASVYGQGANDANFKGYIRNLTFFDDLYSLDYAKASYEAVMGKGLIYTRMKDAYDKYVYINKKLDADAYGSTEFTNAQKQAAAKDLIIATANMGGYSRSKGEGQAWHNASNDVAIPKYYYNHIAWTNRATEFSNETDQNWSREKLVLPGVMVALYENPSDVPVFPVMLEVWQPTGWGKKDRSIETTYISGTTYYQLRDYWYGYGTDYTAWPLYNSSNYSAHFHYTTSYSDNSHHYKNNSNGQHRFFFNKYYYTNGANISSSTHYQKITSNTLTFSSSGETNSVTNNTATQFIIDFTGLFDKIEEKKANIADVLNYKEGGYATVLEAIDEATAYNVVAKFEELANNANASATEAKVQSVVEDMTALIAGINTATASPADRYQALRTVMDMSGTPAEGTTRALRDAYTGATSTLGYSDETYAVFKAEYERAVAAFDDVLTNGYTGTYDNKAVGTIATDLEAKFLALDAASGTAPTVVGNTLLNTTDTVTITNKEAEADDNKVYYEITYNTGATKTGEFTLALDESDTVAPFSYTEAEGADTATVRAWVKNDGKNSPSGSLNVTLYKAPTGTPTVLGKNDTITLTSQNGANAGTIMYSYDNSQWNAYSAPFAPFADNGAGTRTIYVKEEGTGVTSSVGQITVARAGSLSAYADPTPDLGADYYNGSSAIKLATADTYDSIKYQVQKASDSDFGSEQAYDATNGIPASAYANESFIIIKAYAEGNEENATVTTLYNEELYNPLAYQESFNDVTVTNGNTKDVLQSENGYNMTSAANTISVVSGAGTYMSGSTSESHSWRNNVLKINANSTAPGPVVTLNKNPLNQAINAAAVRKNGVTISFWRHIEDTSGNTVSLAENSWDNSGYEWKNAIAFQKEGDNSVYYIIEANGVNSRRVDGSNYYDFAPENQDNTEHEMGAVNGEWEHIAVTINPNSGIKVYHNGVEHDVKYSSGIGSFASGNTAAAAQEILAFLSDGTTQMTLDNGVLYEGNPYNLFLDDIRLYTKPLTQVEINNMYVDEYTDTVTSTTSTSHDPTSVTVYTLTNGKKVGVEYIEKNNISDSEIAAIDYYSFGTGMTIYHATDATQTHWEVLGDSMGRCGYQNQDLFGAEYTTALATAISDAGFTADEISQGAGHLVWAPHVMYNLQRDCWVYYGSLSYWGATHSVTFLATSTDPLKNYQYQGIVYRSNQYHPNAIDFSAFYNADYTALYMTIGSWGWSHQGGRYGAIYGAQLNLDGTAPTAISGTADSLENGTELARAHTADLEDYNGTFTSEAQSSGEGSYVVYIDGYYYLFVSYGGNEGSYTERVWRSENPLGPYVSYNGHTAIDSSAAVDFTRGNQILAPFDIALYDNIFRSTGHNSIYKVKNLKGEWVYVNAVHGRPYASASHEWKAVPDNALAKRQSGGVTGNVTLNNMVAINEDGWMVMFPNQYNGTDSYSTKLTAKQIEGIYTASDMRMSVNSTWGKEYTYTMLADESYPDRGIAFGVKDGITFTSKFYLNYDETKKVQYITIYTDASVDPETATADQIRYKGVVGTHTGKDKYGNAKLIPMLGMLNEYTGTDMPHVLYKGEQSWAYRSGDVPDAADVVSDVDAVALDGVIYTHADDTTEAQVAANHGRSADAVAKSSYALYGQEIADNFKYGTGTTNAERYTTLTVAYPYKIDLSNASAVYCYSDGERCRTGGYTGSLITPVPLNKNTTVGGFDILESGGRYTDTNQLWYDKQTGTTYTDATAAQAGDDVKARLVRYYGFRGSVSDYFKYENGKYTEDGVELIVSYIDIETNEQKQEFEFCYVMPNPAWAHTMAATRNKQADGIGNDRRSSVGNFNRFVDSWGTATPTYSHFLYQTIGNTNSSESNYAHGVSGYLADFDSLNITDDALDSVSDIDQLFIPTNVSEGVNSGSYSVQQHNDTDSITYTANPDVVDANYYVDYSDKQLYDINGGSGLITTAGNGVPTGYTFKMKTSNFRWDPYDGANIIDATSYQVNNTKQKTNNQKLNVTYTSTGATGNIMTVNRNNFESAAVAGLGTRNWTDDEMLYYMDDRIGSFPNYDDGINTYTFVNTAWRNAWIKQFSDGTQRACKNDNPAKYLDNTTTAPMYWNYADNPEAKAYTTYDNGKSSTHAWQGTATFTGKYSVVPNTYQQLYSDTLTEHVGQRAGQAMDISAESYANYILELGTYHSLSVLGVGGGRFIGHESYHYYNIGVHTCDKGAMRQFAEEVLNQDIDLETYAETGEIVTTGPIDSSKVSYASYKDYIRAVAKCMWFAENPKNTTAGDLAGQEQYAEDYAERESDDMEYRTAYDAEGNAIYDSTTEGSNIFQDGTTTTDPVQAQLVKDVIEAYANLYDVTKYAEVESEYKKTKEFFEAAEAENDAYRQAQIDAGVAEDEVKDLYSQQSRDNYENALDAIKTHAVNYFIYWDEGPNKDTQYEEDGKYHVVDAEGNPVIDPETGEPKTIDIVDTALEDEEFWRKSALTGEEYEELKQFMIELRGSLVEPVDETPLTSQMNNAVVPTFDSNGTPVYDANGDVVTVEADASKKEMDENGIFNNEGTQVYSYNSWKALDDCLYETTATYSEYIENIEDTREQMLEDRKDSAEELSDGFGANDLVGKTSGSNKYATLGERNLKDLLNTVDDVKYEIQLDATDENSPYRSRDQLAVDMKAAELAPLVTKPVDTVDAYNAYNSAYAIVSAVDLNKYIDPSMITAELNKRRPEVYVEVTQEIANTYNSRVGSGKTQLTPTQGATGELRVLSLGETDPYTAALLTAVATMEADPATYIKKFKAQLTVSKLDASGNQAAGFPQTISQEKYYGETFSFNVPGLTETTTTDEETGKTTTTLDQAVTYSVSVKDGLAANFENAEVIGSTKWTYKGTTLDRLADANVEIAANIIEDKTSTNDLQIKFYNIYGRVVKTSYVANAPTNAEGDPVVYNGENVLYRAEEVPFYYFDHYEVNEVKDANENVIGYEYKAKYTAEKPVTFTKPEGATLTGGRGDNASVDDLMTLSTEASDFYAWAVKTSDNKYAIASYDATYNFYAADDTDFAMITKVTDGDGYKYQVDGTDLTASMISGTVGEFADNTGTQNYPYGAEQFLKEKLDQKAPFISVISSSVSKDANGNPITDADGKYIVKSYAIVTSGCEAKINNVTFVTGVTVNGTRKTATANITNINDYGQFTVTVKVKNSVPASCDGKATLNYKFVYSYGGTDYTINAKDTTIQVNSKSNN